MWAAIAAVGVDPRTAQVNIRLTPREKIILERAAQARGFKGISDYIRARVLSA